VGKFEKNLIIISITVLVTMAVKECRREKPIMIADPSVEQTIE